MMISVGRIAALLLLRKGVHGLETSAPGRRVFLRMTRLVGGPKFARLHSACFVEQTPGGALIGWDFLPVDPLSPRTAAALLTLRTSPGEVRELRVDSPDRTEFAFVGTSSEAGIVDELRSRATQSSPDLHLVFNQCWGHSLDLASFATGRKATSLLPLMLSRVLSTPPNNMDESEPEEPASPEEEDPLLAELAAEKNKRFGVPLYDIISDDDKLQSARAAMEFEQALQDAASSSNRSSDDENTDSDENTNTGESPSSDDTKKSRDRPDSSPGGE